MKIVNLGVSIGVIVVLVSFVFSHVSIKNLDQIAVKDLGTAYVLVIK